MPVRPRPCTIHLPRHVPCSVDLVDPCLHLPAYFAGRPCHVRTTSPAPTDRARAPQVRHTSPLYFRSTSIFLSVFPAPSPPPSGFSIGECLDEIDRIQTVVQPVGLTVELPSPTHGPTPVRTWTGRNPGMTLLGAPQDPRRRRSRRYPACLHY